jgi:hypothetical protein
VSGTARFRVLDVVGLRANGKCNNVSGSGNQQTCQFILTGPDGPGTYMLTAQFADSGTKTDTVNQTGNGAVHFSVTTSAGDTLLSASATGGTTGQGGSVLTVSDCTLTNAPPATTGPPGTMALPGTTAPPRTNAPAGTTAPPGMQAVPPPPPAAAVVAGATLTG